ncbi:exodeoxyribonuclease VII small subunit [Sulfurimonas sp. MAG313]|nr:exodeoxyribonuclease VII small subunit [Sulfurimonas sp. MAG313]MDF1880342.1 exodeoxyribonuclease VII small subunit [Sulfurimonas sp. MAG313]
MAKEKLIDFETKLDDAKKVLQTLMDPELTLDASVKSYKEGMKTLQDAQKILESATLEFEKIQAKDS